MRVIFYYRCTDPRLVEAKTADTMRQISIQQGADQFAALFQAKPVFTQGFNPRFAGICEPKLNPKLWSKPVQGNPCVKPLMSSVVHRADKARSHTLNEMFDKHWPADIAAEYDSELLSALGISTAATVGNAVSYHYDDDKVSWIASSLPLNGTSLDGSALQFFTEILASEFDVARAKFEAKQHALQTAVATAPAANEG